MLSRKIQKAWCFYFCLWHWNIRWYLKFTYSCFRKSILVSLKKFLWYAKRAKHSKRGEAGSWAHLMTPLPLPIYDHAFPNVLQNRRSQKSCNIHRKTSMLEETPTQMIFCQNYKILKNIFFIELVWWLLPNALMENTNVMIFDHINKFINVFLTIWQQKNITKGILLFEIIYVSWM